MSEHLLDPENCLEDSKHPIQFHCINTYKRLFFSKALLTVNIDTEVYPKGNVRKKNFFMTQQAGRCMEFTL